METTAIKNQTQSRLVRECLSLPLAFLSYFFLDFSLRWLYGSAGNIPLLAWQPLVFTALWALLLTCAAALMPRLGRRIFLSVTFVAFALLCVAHCVLYKLTGNVLSFADLAYAGDGAKFLSLTYLNIRKAEWASIAVCLVLMILSVCWTPATHYSVRRTVPAAVLIVGCAIGILCVHNSLYQDRNSEMMRWDVTLQGDTYCDYYSNFENANQCLMLTGVYQYTFRSMVTALAPDGQTGSPEEYAALDEYYAAYPKPAADGEMTGAFEGKNLILMMLESIDTWLVTPEYMPNLYALTQEGISFSNYYSPMFISAATFNAEFIANTGLLPPTSGIANDAYVNYTFPYSLAHLFENAGYTANSFHSANAAIYNRGAIHRNFGYEAYHNYEDMGMDDYMLDSQLICGYDQYVANEPFFSFLITYSGHGPYTEELSNISDPHLEQALAVIDYDTVPYKTEAQKSEYTLAVAHAMETDAFIGELMTQLRADGHAEDTAVVLFTDHYCKYISDTEFVMDIKGVANHDLLTNVPFVIWSADQPGRVEEKYVSTMDIAPTIVNLFGLDADLRYYMGDDMFGPNGGVVAMRDYHWYDGTTYYDGAEYHSAAAAPGDMADTTAAVRERLDIAWRTFRSNYFEHLEK